MWQALTSRIGKTAPAAHVPIKKTNTACDLLIQLRTRAEAAATTKMKETRRQALPPHEPPETENEIGTSSRAVVGYAYAYGVARPILVAAALFTLLLLLVVLPAIRRSSPLDVLLSAYSSPEKSETFFFFFVNKSLDLRLNFQ